MAYQTPLTVKETLDRVARGRLVLPAIQREFVWVSDLDRMTRLFDSLLRGYPIGTFLFWDVPAEQSMTFDFYEVMRTWHERDRRHNARVHLTEARDLTAVLDGQQRLTTLNIGIHGSIAQRARYKRSTSVDAYPAKRLYVDLLFEPTEDDEVEYRFAFLTEQQSAVDTGAHWYRVGEIARVEDPGLPILRYVNAQGLSDRERPFEVMARLWSAVHRDGVVSAFEEKGEKLSRVLDIFVRVNSGGVVLSKSDLLLSVATAQFRSKDAREEVHRLVDDLNAEGAGFAFSKDLVLKAGLVLTGISDIGFRVENFTSANMQKLEDNWDRVADALRVAARLLASFGFSKDTLPASSVLVPLADYVFQRSLTEAYIDAQAPVYRDDRQAVRRWTIRTILMPGIWGSGLDGLLRGLHRAVVDTTGGFPVEAIEAEMARRGKALIFDDALLDDLVETTYKHPRAFALLTLLYETVETVSKFHVDHVFPRALSTRPRLRAAGIAEQAIDDVRERVERLPNLQLLHGPVNMDKRASAPLAWVTGRFPDARAREAWLAENDLLGLPPSFADFSAFYEQRRDRMRRRLVDLLTTGRASVVVPMDVSGSAPTRTATQQPDEVAVGRTVTALPELAATVLHRSDVSVRRTRTVFEERLADLLADGRLGIGQKLHGDYYGRRYECLIERDGLRFDGRTFDDPSPAAMAITNGPVNGWKFWKTASGEEIGGLRRR